MVNVEQAHGIVVRTCPVMPVVSLPLKSALGYVLAEDVTLGIDLPSLESGSDSAAQAEPLPTAEGSPASDPFVRDSRQGKQACALGIAAGTERPMPAQHLTLAQTEPGKALHSEHVLRAGHLIRAQEAFVLAETGHSWARVYRRPRVAVLAVGSRLASLCSELGPRMLYRSNPCFLCALCAEIGIPTTNAGIIPYEHDHLEQCLEENLTDHDVAVVCGGSGQGKNDLLPSVLRRIRFESHFCGLVMNPGNHNLFATRANKVVFGLPRNPLGLLASFVLLVRDGLRRMMGFQEPVPDILIAHLRKEASNPDEVRSYLPAKLYRVGGRWEVLPIVCENASDAFALTKADALLALPPQSNWPEGACAQVVRLKE